MRNHGVHVLISSGRAHPKKVSSRQCPWQQTVSMPLGLGDTGHLYSSMDGTSFWAGKPWRYEEGAVES